MTNSKFPFGRLPDNLCSKVLETMDHREIIAYSFLSKKASSMVQSLGLPLKKAQININERLSVDMDFGNVSVQFKFKMGKGITSFNDIPVNVSIGKHSQIIDKITKQFLDVFISTEITWSNKKKSIGEWIKHLCSIFRCDSYGAGFVIGEIRFDMQSLRKTFPKLRRIGISCFKDEPNEQDIQNAQNILRTFLPHAERVGLGHVPLQENLSIQHIGMANLKQLSINTLHPEFEHLSTWNTERCLFLANHIPLRDLNRFFKFWTKGSNPRLKYLEVLGRTVTDWNGLMKGLQAEGKEDRTRTVKEYTIRNCHGTCARIKIINYQPIRVAIMFTVSE